METTLRRCSLTLTFVSGSTMNSLKKFAFREQTTKADWALLSVRSETCGGAARARSQRSARNGGARADGSDLLIGRLEKELLADPVEAHEHPRHVSQVRVVDDACLHDEVALRGHCCCGEARLLR
jgi:hypothetical protein